MPVEHPVADRTSIIRTAQLAEQQCSYVHCLLVHYRTVHSTTYTGKIGATAVRRLQQVPCIRHRAVIIFFQFTVAEEFELLVQRKINKKSGTRKSLHHDLSTTRCLGNLFLRIPYRSLFLSPSSIPPSRIHPIPPSTLRPPQPQPPPVAPSMVDTQPDSRGPKNRDRSWV